MSFEAVVDDLCEQQRTVAGALWQMALSETEFRPGDRGVLTAFSRKGTKLELTVLRVESDATGRVWHIVEKPLAAGTAVTGEVASIVLSE